MQVLNLALCNPSIPVQQAAGRAILTRQRLASLESVNHARQAERQQGNCRWFGEGRWCRCSPNRPYSVRPVERETGFACQKPVKALIAAVVRDRISDPEPEFVWRQRTTQNCRGTAGS